MIKLLVKVYSLICVGERMRKSMKVKLFEDNRKIFAIIFSAFVLLSIIFCVYRVSHFVVNGFSKSTIVLYKGPPESFWQNKLKIQR